MRQIASEQRHDRRRRLSYKFICSTKVVPKVFGQIIKQTQYSYVYFTHFISVHNLNDLQRA